MSLTPTQNVNFGSAYDVVLDFYMGTQGRTTTGAWGKTYTLKRQSGVKGEVREGEKVTLCIEERGSVGTNGAMGHKNKSD